jgi:hypothetical protein
MPVSVRSKKLQSIKFTLVSVRLKKLQSIKFPFNNPDCIKSANIVQYSLYNNKMGKTVNKIYFVKYTVGE